MNKLIKQELEKVKVADISNYNSDEHTFIIPKTHCIHFEEDNCYIIKLADVLLSEDDTSAFANNLNGGTYPPSKYMQIDVTKVVGKLIEVTGISYDVTQNKPSGSIWSGWIPTDKVEIIKKV